jgi:hypothetical protein
MMKKPYIKKYKRVSNFNVYIVDGKYIRDNMNEEFTNCGQHYLFDFIPENEFWIDKEGKKGEKKFYIESMLNMNRFLKKGISHSEATKRANLIEEAERAKSKFMEQKLKLRVYPDKLINSMHKKLLKEYSKHIKVWIVSGEEVRGLFFIDFTEGGHGYVYNFIPKEEVWIDDDLDKGEIPLVLLHELHERRLMQRKKLDYDTAHLRSSKIEYYCRKHPKMLDKKLKKEIEKNK